MKARPRKVEREIAAYFNRLIPHLTPMERIPILGRTGPDLTTNELNLVIDVKSRIGVPNAYVSFHNYDDRFLIIPLEKLPGMKDEGSHTRFNSKVVHKWYDHMDEWTRRHNPNGISALVLHRPKMPYGKATLILSKSDYRRFLETWNKLHSLPTPLPQA